VRLQREMIIGESRVDIEGGGDRVSERKDKA